MTRPSFAWQINWPLTIVALLLLPLLIGLGSWQLARAEQKRVAQAAFEQLRDAAPQSLLALPSQPDNYTNAQVRGEFDAGRTLLIDNRIVAGRFGYEVVMPLRVTGSDEWILINRGWIEGDPSRRTLPQIAPIGGEVALHGHLYRDQAGFELAGAEQEQRWPRVVSHLDFTRLADELHVSLRPYSLRLDADSPAALAVDWRVVNMGPEQHIGYAVQWFAMAIALVSAWLFASSNLWQRMKRQ